MTIFHYFFYYFIVINIIPVDVFLDVTQKKLRYSKSEDTKNYIALNMCFTRVVLNDCSSSAWLSNKLVNYQIQSKQ